MAVLAGIDDVLDGARAGSRRSRQGRCRARSRGGCGGRYRAASSSKASRIGWPISCKSVRLFVAHSRDFEAAAEIEGGDAREFADHAEAEPGDALPDGGIAAGADVGVDADDAKAVLGDDGPGLAAVFVPDAEAGRRAADVGLDGAAGAEAGVDSQAKLAARELLAEAPELVERAGVEADAALEEPAEICRELLSAQRDV